MSTARWHGPRNNPESFQGQSDHGIGQEGLRDVQEIPCPVHGPACETMTSAELDAVTGTPDEPEPHRAGMAHGPGHACQACGEECVTITWSEIRNYSATVHRSELAEAVSVPGSGNPALDPGADGHAMPERLSDLTGDPFTHGDLNGLLCDLENRSFDDAEAITVLSVDPAS